VCEQLGKWILASRLEAMIDAGVPHPGDRDVDAALQPHQGTLRKLLKGRCDAPILCVSPPIRRFVPSRFHGELDQPLLRYRSCEGN
jgi:hypothetical protein